MDAVTLRSRREVLRLARGVAVGALCGARGLAFASSSGARTLALYCVNTGEHLAVEYWAHGEYEPEALTAVDRLLRDHRTDATRPMDPFLLDQLSALGAALGSRESFHVVCGYRSPETNALKRHEEHGVAGHSFHMAGRAVDVFLPGRPLGQLRAAALRLAQGGVGYYPGNNFVHLDTGPLRFW